MVRLRSNNSSLSSTSKHAAFFGNKETVLHWIQMKNRNHAVSYWALQALVVLAFLIYDIANVELNKITEFNKIGNLQVWRLIYRTSCFIWISGWILLVLGSLLGMLLDWYDSNLSKAKHVGLAFFFAPLMVLIAAVIFQPL
jgi:hypothetical protein